MSAICLSLTENLRECQEMHSILPIQNGFDGVLYYLKLPGQQLLDLEQSSTRTLHLELSVISLHCLPRDLVAGRIPRIWEGI